jgi:hypothetical protein
MARLPIYEQQVASKSNSVTPQEMGAGVGQAMGQVGSVLTDIGVTMKRREDTLDRVRLNNEFDIFAQQSIEALSAEDMANPATVKKYQEGLRAKADEVLSTHSGSSESRAQFQSQIENQIGQYTKGALAAQVKAQYKMVGDIVDQTSNELAIKGSFAPQEMGNIFSEFDGRLSTLKDAIPADMYDSFRISGRQKIATNSINSLLNQGNFSSAKALMNDPNVGAVLDPNTARKFTIDIAVDEGKQAVEIARQEQNVRKFTANLGRDLTPEEVLRIKALPPQKDMTVADQITEYEVVTGKPAPQTVIDKFYKVEAETGGGIGGNSLKAQAIRFVTENAVNYANGLMDPQQARTFEAMYTEAYAAVDKQDPLTGLWTKIQPTVPSYAQEAMRRGSGRYGGLSMPVQGPGEVSPMSATAGSGGGGTVVMKDGQPLDRPPRPGENIELMVDGRMVGGTTVGADGKWAISGAQGSTPSAASAEQKASLWNRRANITGVVPSAAQALGRLPVIGETLDGGGQYTTDRQYAEASSRELIRALSQSGRYMASEMAAIEKEVDISGQVLDNPEAYARRLIGIDEALERRIGDETKILANPNTPLEQRKAAESVINVITNFRQTLGVPQKVKSKEEAMKLPPGTEFIDPNGVVRVVPGAR